MYILRVMLFFLILTSTTCWWNVDFQEFDPNLCNPDVENAGFSCGDDFFDCRNGKWYRTTLIGSQCWFAENLDVGTFRTEHRVWDINNGICFSELIDTNIYKFYYNDNPIDNSRGGYYTWCEAIRDTLGFEGVDNVRGICPKGSHIPSFEESSELLEFIDWDIDKLMNPQESYDFGAMLSGYKVNGLGGGSSRNNFRTIEEEPAFSFWTSTPSDSFQRSSWVIFYDQDFGSLILSEQIGTPVWGWGNCVRCLVD